MKQSEFTRRALLQSSGAAAAALALGPLGATSAFAADPLKIWTIGVAKVGDKPGTGGKDWSAMEAQAGTPIAYSAKSGSADEAIQKMVVGDGNALYDAMTDNGGGMEDALASQGAIVELDTSKIANWGNLLPGYADGGASADTIRHEGQGRGRALHLERRQPRLQPRRDRRGADQLGGAVRQPVPRPRGDAERLRPDPDQHRDLPQAVRQGRHRQPVRHDPGEVQQTCEFLIDLKKKGHFRTFWDGVQNGADLLSSEEVLVSSCWEVIQIFAARKNGDDIRYGTMKEGHQSWNNVDADPRRPGARHGRRLLRAGQRLPQPVVRRAHAGRFGFGPQMTGVNGYIDAHPDDFDAEPRRCWPTAWRASRRAMERKGNAWQNVFPKEIRAYQDWWAKVQAA
jgi:putative spermidine/putrescine transport system substrate-binding protein